MWYIPRNAGRCGGKWDSVIVWIETGLLYMQHVHVPLEP